MNREILFRGKDANGNWHEGCLHKCCKQFDEVEKVFITAPTASYTDKTWRWLEEQGRGTVGVYWEVIPETVGQLWIVNNVNLFGGDLFEATCSVSGSDEKSTKICQVVDSDQGFSVSVWHNGEWWAYSFIDFTTIKLIGNIHDNSNLLTDAN